MPATTVSTNLDADHDGIGDDCDLCPTVADFQQQDQDEDGIGDRCDTHGLRGGGALFARSCRHTPPAPMFGSLIVLGLLLLRRQRQLAKNAVARELPL